MGKDPQAPPPTDGTAPTGTAGASTGATGAAGSTGAGGKGGTRPVYVKIRVRTAIIQFAPREFCSKHIGTSI